MPKQSNPTTKFKVDISDLKKGITEANRQIRLANSEFKAASDGTKEWENSTDGLSARITQFQKVLDLENKKLENLKEQHRRVVEAEGEHSKAAEELEIKINNQQGAITRVKKTLSQYQNELSELENSSNDAADGSEELSKDLKDVGDEAGNADSMISGLASSLAHGLATGFKMVIAGATALVGAFLATGEASQDHIEDMGKLETAYKSAGKTVEEGQQAYKDFVGILGETDQAVEAVNHLAKLTKSQEELSAWTDIAAGVYATFGDSLPLEGLTEAANETAKVGQVTGAVADALNWAGINEDEFNEKLEATNSEAERAQLITSTLTDLYSEAGNTYQEVNADLIAAREAQAGLNDALADTGRVAMPITTALKNIVTTILNDWQPQIKELGNSILGMLSGNEGAAQQFGDTIAGMVTSGIQKALDVAPEMLKIGAELINMIGQGVMNGIPILIKTGGSILDNLGNGISENMPNFVDKALDALDGFADMLTENVPILIKNGTDFIKNLVQGLVDSIPTFLNKAPEIVSKFANLINDNFPKILKAGIDIIITIVKGLIQAIPTLIANIPKIIQAFIDVWMAFNWLQLGKNAITFLKDGILKMIGAVKGAGKNVLDAIVNVIKNLPSKLGEIGRSGINGITNALKVGVDLVKSAARSIFDGIVNIAKGLPEKMISIGKDLVRGLVNGISNMTGWVLDKIKGFSESVLGGIKDFFGVHSPATTTIEIGEYLDEGLVIGVENKADTVTASFKKIVEDVLSVGQSSVDENAENIGSTLAEEVAAGIGKNQSEAEKKAQELSETILSAAQQKLDNFKVYNDMTLKEEMEFWDEIRKQCEEGTQARIDADKKYLDARKAYEDDLQASVQRVTDIMNSAHSDREKAYLDYEEKCSAAQEKYKEERKKLREEAEKDRAELQSKYQDKVKSANEKYESERAKLTEQYEDNVNKILADKAEERQKLMDNYNKQLQQRTEAIYSSLNLFDNFDVSTEQTADELLNNLQSQVDGMKNWQDDLATLEGRGLDETFLAELQGMGVKAAAQIDLLANMTDEQLTQYVALWKQKMNIAESAAKLELRPVLEQTKNDLAQLNIDTQEKLNQLATTYNANLEKIKVDLNASLAEYKTDLDVGMSNINSTLRKNLSKIKTDLNTSLDEYKSTLYNSLTSIEESVTENLQEMGEKFLNLIVNNIAQTGEQASADAAAEGTKFVDTMNSSISPLTPTLTNIGGQSMQGFWGGMQWIAPLLKSWFDGYVNSVSEAATPLTPSLYINGEQAMQGFWGGMRSVAFSIKSWFEEFCESLIADAEEVLEIGSPSKVFRKIGKWTLQGFENGITDESKNVLSATGRAFRGVVDTAKNVLTPMSGSLSQAKNGMVMGSAQTAKNITYNFNQTNNSPKSLSRLEIYRQSKNLLKGVVVSV